MEAVGEREKVPVMVMGKMRNTDRMVVKDNKTGESLEVARKVTFNPAIRARTVTVEGDVFEPSGIVEGGSRRRGAPVLSLLAKANKVRGELDAKERELDASSRELSEMRKRAEKVPKCEERVGVGAAQPGGVGEGGGCGGGGVGA